MRKTKISIAVIKRLPKYHRYLSDLLKKDIERISSKELSEKIGFTASQIRQDLNNFGDFGQQGYGYNVKELYNEISKIIGLNRIYNTILIGAGNIGQAVANYSKFEKLGFNLKAIFDKNPKMVGLKIRDIKVDDVENISNYLDNNDIDIGIICVPVDNAQKVAETLVDKGIKAIWNFAPTDLTLPNDVTVENVHLSESLMTLCYKLNENILFSQKQ